MLAMLTMLITGHQKDVPRASHMLGKEALVSNLM